MSRPYYWVTIRLRNNTAQCYESLHCRIFSEFLNRCQRFDLAVVHSLYRLLHLQGSVGDDKSPNQHSVVKKRQKFLGFSDKLKEYFQSLTSSEELPRGFAASISTEDLSSKLCDPPSQCMHPFRGIIHKSDSKYCDVGLFTLKNLSCAVWRYQMFEPIYAVPTLVLPPPL